MGGFAVYGYVEEEDVVPDGGGDGREYKEDKCSYAAEETRKSGCSGHIGTREFSGKVRAWGSWGSWGSLVGSLYRSLRVSRRVLSRVLLVVCDGGGHASAGWGLGCRGSWWSETDLENPNLGLISYRERHDTGGADRKPVSEFQFRGRPSGDSTYRNVVTLWLCGAGHIRIIYIARVRQRQRQ